MPRHICTEKAGLVTSSRQRFTDHRFGFGVWKSWRSGTRQFHAARLVGSVALEARRTEFSGTHLGSRARNGFFQKAPHGQGGWPTRPWFLPAPSPLRVPHSCVLCKGGRQRCGQRIAEKYPSDSGWKPTPSASGDADSVARQPFAKSAKSGAPLRSGRCRRDQNLKPRDRQNQFSIASSRVLRKGPACAGPFVVGRGEE